MPQRRPDAPRVLGARGAPPDAVVPDPWPPTGGRRGRRPRRAQRPRRTLGVLRPVRGAPRPAGQSRPGRLPGRAALRRAVPSGDAHHRGGHARQDAEPQQTADARGRRGPAWSVASEPEGHPRCRGRGGADVRRVLGRGDDRERRSGARPVGAPAHVAVRRVLLAHRGFRRLVAAPVDPDRVRLARDPGVHRGLGGAVVAVGPRRSLVAVRPVVDERAGQLGPGGEAARPEAVLLRGSRRPAHGPGRHARGRFALGTAEAQAGPSRSAPQAARGNVVVGGVGQPRGHPVPPVMEGRRVDQRVGRGVR